MDKLIRWKRGSDGYLFLQVLQTNSENKPTWVSYTQATHKKPDFQIPGVRNSKGFATAQRYLELGYKYISCQKEFVMSYIELLTEFLEERISVDKFEEAYLEKFKGEDRLSSDEEFKILDSLFGYVDAYYDEESELFDSEFDLTENGLRHCVKLALYNLQQLSENNND